MAERQGATYKWWQIFLPDRGGWFFVYLLFGLLFMRPELLLWDGGSCRHILNGVLILQNHQIPSDNYTSWVYPDLQCVTRSWLADLISGCFYQNAHLIGVVFVCGLAIAAGLTWSYQMGRARGLGLLSGLLMLSVVMGTVGMHWSARSHIYSYLPFLALYYMLFISPAGWPRVPLIAAIMCFWTNAHGSFAIGMGMIAVKIAFDIVGLVRRNPEAAPELKWDALALIAAFAATGINPRGIALYAAVTGYLINPNVVHKTDEWRSFDMTAGLGSWAFLLLLAAVIALIVRTRKVPSLAELVLFCGLCLGGFESMRLVPYCALLAMPFAGPAWQALRQQVAAEPADSTKHQRWLRKLVQLEQRAEPQEKSGLKLAIACLVIALVMGVVAMLTPSLAVKDFDGERLPVDAVNYMMEHNIDGHGFNYDNWGGYIYLKTGRRVFIDDWADFLPPKFIDQYLQILLAQPGWEQEFKARNFNWVLAPNEAQISQLVARSPQWSTAFKNKTAILLVRKGTQP